MWKLIIIMTLAMIILSFAWKGILEWLQTFYEHNKIACEDYGDCY